MTAVLKPKICVDCMNRIEPLKAWQWATTEIVIKPLCADCYSKRAFPQ